MKQDGVDYTVSLAASPSIDDSGITATGRQVNLTFTQKNIIINKLVGPS